MRVMYVASNPDGAKSLQIEKEISDLRERLDRTSGADPIDFRAYAHLPVDGIPDTIRRFSPHVLHLAAHGQGDGLILMHPGKAGVRLDAGKLTALLAGNGTRPKLIVINACNSAAMAATLAAAGTADFVIGTDAAVTNLAARSMAGTLYQALAGGVSIGDAFTAAAAHLAIVDDGASVSLHPVASHEHARHVRLVNPFRIMACLPLIERAILEGRDAPDASFEAKSPAVLLGLAGAPVATRQTVVFTDDETVKIKHRQWTLMKQPDEGEIWMPDHHVYWGDMNWFAAVSTNDGGVRSAAASTCTALRRYYLQEQWHPGLPAAYVELIEEVIANLDQATGSRRKLGARR